MNLTEHALNMKKTALRVAYECGGSAHIGGGLSCIDILAVIYGQMLRPQDKFILSKGHGVLGLYSALAEFGKIPPELLKTFQQDGSDLIAHPVMNEKLGIESSSGSLGQGISMATGLALSAKKKHIDSNIYVLCGNGECNEGSVYEAVNFAVQFELDNLTIVIDNNHIQSDGFSKNIMNVSDRYTDIFKSLGCKTFEIDGHNIEELTKTFEFPTVKQPKAVIANTVKGKGVSFMENNNDWHHNRLTEEQYKSALSELEAVQC